MITNIKINGFKSFLDFDLDVPPFLVLVGTNSSGKSNLFDALEFEHSAFTDQEWLRPRRGRPHEQFHLVDHGEKLTELEIRVERTGGSLGPGRDSVRSVHARFNDAGELEVRAIGPWTEVGEEEGNATTVGNGPSIALNEIFYVPSPPSMRNVSSAEDRRPLTRDGSNLAAVLGRMQGAEAFGDLLVDLTALTEDVVGVVPDLDEKRREWSFDLEIIGQGRVPSTLLSDGTLRILGLLAALHDPVYPGVLLVEEIENGLHPSRLAELLRRLSGRVHDKQGPSSGRRQVILTSHSPVVVSEMFRTAPDSLVFLDSAVRTDPGKGRRSRVTVAKPVRESGEPGTYVSPRQVRQLLGSVRQDTS